MKERIKHKLKEIEESVSLVQDNFPDNFKEFNELGLVKDGMYLIAKRAEWEKAFPGKWTVPGGKLEVLDYSLNQKDTITK